MNVEDKAIRYERGLLMRHAHDWTTKKSTCGVTLQRALLSDLDKGTSFDGKDASAPRCLARPGNAATNIEWRLSPNGWNNEQRKEDGLK